MSKTLVQRFQYLDDYLSLHQSLWRSDPFHQALNGQIAWFQEYPQLAEFIENLSQQELQNLQQDPNRLTELLSSYIQGIEAAFKACRLDKVQTQTRFPILNGIPGRKWQQICAMGEVAMQSHDASEWLEWCAGKGYLGQLLAQHSNMPVVSFEWQQSLCDSGQQLANQRRLPMLFKQGDAFSPEASRVFKSDQHAVALHACGDLHVKLLQYASQYQVKQLTLSPCCYHLIKQDHYQPLSQLATNSNIRLTQSELRTPLQKTVTGGQRVSLHRQQEMSYRLGFDLLLRAQLGIDEYTPIPSIKKSELQYGFEHFCQWACQQKNLDIPLTDLAQWQEKGEERFWFMEKLNLIQGVFQRPLELWLVCDKAHYLQEQGYQVTLSTFCEPHVTPRNILIQATR